MPTHSTGALRLTASLCAFSLIIASRPLNLGLG
jgi:hypothetical protein